MTHPPHVDQGLLPLVRRRWRSMGLAFGLFFLGGTAYLVTAPKQYEASAMLLVMRSDQRLGGIKVLNDSLPELNTASRPLFTQVELMRVRPVFAETIRRLGLKEKDGKPLGVDTLARQVRVDPVKDTDVVTVTYDAHDPVQARDVVATLCEAYLKETERYRREGVKEALRYVDEQLSAARARLERTERALAAFKRDAGSVNLNEEIQTQVHQLGDLDALIRSRQIELKAARARAESLRRALGMSEQAASDASLLSASPTLKSLEEQLVAAQTSPLFSQGLAPGHPDMVALRQRIRLLEQQINQEIKSQVGHAAGLRAIDPVKTALLEQLTIAETEALSDQASLTAAQGSRGELSADMATLPNRELRMTHLTREVEVASQIDQQLLQKREEASLALAIAPTYAQVVQPAEVPRTPVEPLKGPAAPVLLVGAFALAFAVGVLRDLFGRPIEASELAGYLPNIRLFASLPALPRKELARGELVARRNACPDYLEAMRALGFALEDRLGAGGKALALTSSVPGEGKSVTLANLAMTLAESGHRVLLVDADFRRPRVHRLFNLGHRRAGLSEVILGTARPDEAVNVCRFIDVVTAGRAYSLASSAKKAPAKPYIAPGYLQRLRAPARIARLKTHLAPVLDEWRQAYDYILLDLPPLVLFSEVAWFAKAVDGLLILANPQRVDPEVLVPKIQQLEAVRIPVLGAIAISRVAEPAHARYYLLSGEGAAS